ncbi:MAG: alpha/beta fold hydrolase [Petrotogales bacterium]
MKELRKHGEQPYEIALIHGGPGAQGDMYPMAKHLSSIMGVLEPIQTKSSIDKLMNQLRDIIEKNAVKPVVMIGHSWGSWLSIIFAAENSLLVKRLILIGCAPLESKYAKDIYKTRLNRLTDIEKKKFTSLIESLNYSDNMENIAELFELFKKTDSYETITVKEDMKFSLELHNLIWSEAEKLRKTGQLLDYVDRIVCPITIVHGKYDPHPAEGVIKPLKERCRDVNLIVLEKCGHTPWIEKYAKREFYALLEREISADS